MKKIIYITAVPQSLRSFVLPSMACLLNVSGAVH